MPILVLFFLYFSSNILLYSEFYLFLKVSLKRKLGEQVEKPRFLENEGYYVGHKPYITKKNKNLMTDRLLRIPDQVNKFT